MLVRLIYVSKLAPNVDHRSIRDILAASQRNNQPRGVSGLLMFNSGFFLQWLEGERRAVNERFARIAQDERHIDPLLLDYQVVVSRQFPNWNMGYLGEGTMNRAAFYEFGASEQFDPYALSGAAAEALMLSMRAQVPLLKTSG
ncbi:MAG: hypothetical protein B7Y07_08540 [Halothiobacillus sp. 24-54-40]|jgi:hypothetical protein|nr:BLUF domain-containing protein [Halothiobacillaceae bacterium]OYV47118.1 MAG: hypothetical protein B7X12_02280 [Halothiobacillus sp. 20-53-49]OYY40811.1 MAG: hypothetical protein B7Y58_03335 [Halothiobacillus sp. 35-54-62]OYY56077.1 MAG: hypothetical protein B7Y53_02595 [Halothiobacillus sp. 28-55-5]OYZ86291.1 MAG: hypothetical protein B7Y07_08540 [Halothiobacillus sp. 24-54-40]OZA80127.1 MAG: hypothetical protein B7X64_07085 [Halothiobacillus sp. 39-53-45]HQS03415.1 BLUF domain-containing